MLHNGDITHVNDGEFDAATCILTAHFVADDGAKANFLTAIRQRLKPGAPLVIVNLCGTSKDPAFAEAVRAWRRHAEVNAMPAEHLDAMVTNALALPFVSEAREHELLVSPVDSARSKWRLADIDRADGTAAQARRGPRR